MHNGILISPTSSCLGKYAVRFNGFTREGRSENVELRSCRIVISSEAEKSSLQTDQRYVLGKRKNAIPVRRFRERACGC